MGEWYKTTKTIFRAPPFFKTRSFTTVYGNNTVVYQRKCPVYGLRISPYTITDIDDRNTVTCNTEKYGRIRSVYTMYTVVYDAVYGRLRPYTEFVTLDLGCQTTSTSYMGPRSKSLKPI
jgi:hypothetical protein